MQQRNLVELVRNLRKISDESRKSREKAARHQYQKQEGQREEGNKHEAGGNGSRHFSCQLLDKRPQKQLQKQGDEEDKGKLRQIPEGRKQNGERDAEQDRSAVIAEMHEDSFLCLQNSAVGLFDLVEAFSQDGGIFIIGRAGHDGLRTEHDRIAAGVSLAFVVPVVIGSCQIAHDEAGTLFGAHAIRRCRHGKIFRVYFDKPVFEGYVIFTEIGKLFDISVTARIVRRMIGKELLDYGGLALGKIQDALPDCCRCPRIVVRMRDVIKGKRVSFLLHRFGDMAVVDDLCHDSACLRARGSAEYLHVQRLFGPLGRMIFLAVGKLMAEHDGDFIFVLEDFVESGIDAQVMSQRTECIEALLVVDEIIIRLVINRGIDRADAGREVRHDACKLLIECPVVIDPVLFFHLLKVFLPSFLGIIVLVKDGIQLGMCLHPADYSADDAGCAG